MLVDDNNALQACFRVARVVACDPVVFRGKKVLLVKRVFPPSAGEWCLPGGIMERNETCEECVVRELREESGLIGKVKSLIGVYSTPQRDVRQTVAVGFLVEEVGGQFATSEETSAVEFFELNALPKIAFDHAQVIEDASKLAGLK